MDLPDLPAVGLLDIEQERHRSLRVWAVFSYKSCGRVVAVAGNRADLLAELAGIRRGASRGEVEEAEAQWIGNLCVDAGADPKVIEQWVTVGKSRAQRAAARPH